jgi:hypothetical protein
MRNEKTEVISRLEFCRIERYSGFEDETDGFWVFGPEEAVDPVKFSTREEAEDFANRREIFWVKTRALEKSLGLSYDTKKVKRRSYDLLNKATLKSCFEI